MKIGIITFHNVINYGAVLQTLATQTVLTNMGEDASVVNYTPPKIDCIYKPFSLTKYKLHAKKSLFVLAHSVLSDFRHFVSINRKRKCFADFCNRFLNLDFKKCKKYD